MCTSSPHWLMSRSSSKRGGWITIITDRTARSSTQLRASSSPNVRESGPSRKSAALMKCCLEIEPISKIRKRIFWLVYSQGSLQHSTACTSTLFSLGSLRILFQLIPASIRSSKKPHQPMAPENQPDEFRSRYKISLPHAARLTDKSIGPLKATITDPLWSPRIGLSVKVEYGTNRTDYRNIKLPPVGLHPFFLLWCGHTNPENIRFGIIDGLHHSKIFQLAPISIRRRQRTAECQRWELTGETFGNPIQNMPRGSEEEDTPPVALLKCM